MEKILSDLIGSVKNYFKMFYLYYKGTIGLYFYLFCGKKEGSELEKYTNLVYSFLIFYFAGLGVGRNLLLNSLGLSKSFLALVDHFLSSDSNKGHLKLLASLIVILEVTAWLFVKKKTDRAVLSRFNFLVASWSYFVFAILILVSAVLHIVFSWFHLSADTVTGIIGILGILIGLFAIWRLLDPFFAVSLFQTKNKLKDSFLSKALLLNILIPIIIVFLAKGIFGMASFEDDVFYLNDNQASKEEISLQVYPALNRSYLIEMELITENTKNSSIIFDPRSGGIVLHWLNSEDQIRTDSILLKNKDTTFVGLLPHIPQKLRFIGYVNNKTFLNLRYLKDSCTDNNIYLTLNTLNAGRVHVAYLPFKIIIHH